MPHSIQLKDALKPIQLQSTPSRVTYDNSCQAMPRQIVKQLPDIRRIEAQLLRQHEQLQPGNEELLVTLVRRSVSMLLQRRSDPVLEHLLHVLTILLDVWERIDPKIAGKSVLGDLVEDPQARLEGRVEPGEACVPDDGRHGL